MKSIPCSILVTLDSLRFALVNPGDTLEITRVECDEKGNVFSLTLVPFFGPEIVATLRGEINLQSICNVSSRAFAL